MQQAYERFYFHGSNCTLSAVDFGNPDRPDLVIVHGMRDHALAMSGIAREFAADYHVVVPDLRGHGDSDNPGSYAMIQLIADLAALIRHHGLSRPVLIGHSLGGHIVMKYAAIYPNEVPALVLIDGMGPPRGDEDVSVQAQQERWRMNVENALQLKSEGRRMQDEAEAFERLTANNPRLDHDLARLIVEHGVEPHPEGGVRWKWDPAVNMVWSTFDQREGELQYGIVECPVLIVTGEHSMEYWSGRRFDLERDDDLHERETQRRRKLFRNARHESIPGAGHMIHYDEPEALNRCLRAFLEGTLS